jgi:hypothetical protein
MKHLRPFLIVLTAYMLVSTVASSQNMVLRLQGGTDQTIPLSNLQKITFSNNNLVLNYVSGEQQQYGFSSLEKLYFSPLTAIKNTVQPKTDIFFNASDNQIHFRNLAEGSHLVSVYRTDGGLVVRKTITNNESVDMNGYPSSIYLIRINNQTLKFKK